MWRIYLQRGDQQGGGAISWFQIKEPLVNITSQLQSHDRRSCRAQRLEAPVWTHQKTHQQAQTDYAFIWISLKKNIFKYCYFSLFNFVFYVYF